MKYPPQHHQDNNVNHMIEVIKTSKAFYEKLGFTEFHGNIEQNWLIMKNDTTTIDLFQGMFEQNILGIMLWNIKQTIWDKLG